MPFAPWTQQIRGARYGEPPEEPPPDNLEPWRERYPGLSDRTLQMIIEGRVSAPTPTKGYQYKFTTPSQEEHWAESNLPSWAQNVLKGAWTGGLTTLGLLGPAALIGKAGAFATKYGAIPGIPPTTTAKLAGVAGKAAKIPSWASIPIGGLAGYTLGQIPMGTTPVGQVGRVSPPTTPAGITPAGTTPGAGGLPQPGAEVPLQIIEVGGERFWYDRAAGSYQRIPPTTIPEPGLTVEQQMAQAELERQAALERAQLGVLSPEQQMAQAELDRQAALQRTQISAGLTPQQQMAMAEAQRQAQMEQLQIQLQAQSQQLQTQFRAQQQLQTQQAQYTREQQAAAAAQQMAQMYAADPYKYWAQQGRGTPEAVAALTGGQIAPGERFGRVPLSYPSAQWWGNLLPSEQQQIGGGLNWMGVNPADWYSMYQRMIPGLGSRQGSQYVPSWVR